MLNDGSGKRPPIFLTRIDGRFEQLHKLIGTILIALFFAGPWTKFGDHPFLQINLPERRVYLLGQVFTALDTPIIWMGLLVGALALGLASSMLGRIWCGYACPQTVFLHEFAHRIEAWVEGTRVARMRLAQAPWSASKVGKKLLKWSLFAIASLLVGFTAMAYFEHPDRIVDGTASATIYLLAGILSAVLFADLAWFREQFCNYLCPYARIQSVLQDPHTLTIGYDATRGEPRRGTEAHGGPIDLSGNTASMKGAGDCIDCGLCVAVCPQGIDIRMGFQLECIACARCIDACHSVMERRGKVTLVNYTTEAKLQGQPTRRLRKRPFVYGALILALSGVLAWLVLDHNELDATLSRAPGPLFTMLNDHTTQNQFRAHVVNYTGQPQTYELSLQGLSDAQIISPAASIPVPAGAERDIPLFIIREASGDSSRTIPFNLVIRAGHDQVIRPATFKSGHPE